MAFKSKMNYQGKEIVFKLYDQFGRLLDKEKLYKRSFKLKWMNVLVNLSVMVVVSEARL